MVKCVVEYKIIIMKEIEFLLYKIIYLNIYFFLNVPDENLFKSPNFETK